MPLKIEENVSLANHTTLKVGGAARYFVTVETEAELLEAFEFAHQNTSCTPLILGAGECINFRKRISRVGHQRSAFKAS